MGKVGRHRFSISAPVPHPQFLPSQPLPSLFLDWSSVLGWGGGQWWKVKEKGESGEEAQGRRAFGFPRNHLKSKPH